VRAANGIRTADHGGWERAEFPVDEPAVGSVDVAPAEVGKAS
jgi:hypothetical protein